jgi:hypothetical protein
MKYILALSILLPHEVCNIVISRAPTVDMTFHDHVFANYIFEDSTIL